MRSAFAFLLLAFSALVMAQGNLEVNTPAISQVKSAMTSRHAQLAPHYASGALGLARDATVQVRDANAIPLAQRGAVQSAVAAENSDRATLYREIAKANGNPAWEADIRATFAQRWIDKAQPGWWVQNAQGAWVKK
ncbi:YdbL family protein [Sulfurisoma sediminicola]|uniref:DUF1318 domain-containing protein n=1 Tax=Sulfurisoma sediminicola TaxID=1381557 RepID=A0A497XGH1_9PROT|nr:YdbL family protein [Sulfurisoma sediminicola]RLJ65107.1 hypothetical protein DFR35_1763 [Sulfurisoma sediminicola]